MTDPTGLFGGFTYNGSGQLTRYTDRAGNPISLTYDGREPDLDHHAQWGRLNLHL